MIEVLNDLPEGLDGLKAVGKVSKEDYDKVVAPLLEQARIDGRRLRFLYEFGPDFDGFTAGAAWEDLKLGLGSMRLFAGCAIVSDIHWIRGASRLGGLLIPAPLRVFHLSERDEALSWLTSLGDKERIRFRLLQDEGVIVVEVMHPLRKEDFDALAWTADAQIEAKGGLAGLVIHSRHLPGWDDPKGFFRHIRFVREHHREVKRVAMVTESLLMGLAPRVAEHFVAADLREFGYDDLDTAIAWAATGELPADWLETTGAAGE